MPLVPFSERYPGEFLSREEDNFDVFLDKLKMFYEATTLDVDGRKTSRRKIEGRFSYKEELKNLAFNDKGIKTEAIASELNDILSGCIRYQDPTTAFNMIPTPLFDSVAGITLASIYNPNTCWDFLSGKICLYEKKIVKMLGGLVDWAESGGFVVTGGKQALAYAIRNGMFRAGSQNSRKMNEYVVICSVLAHYSIEHVCDYLGISSDNCIRVAALPSGEIDLKDLKKNLENVVKNGKKVAAIIGVGGGTVNLIPDPISSIKKLIDEFTKEYQLNYTPYFHVDSVITWPWLAFQKHSELKVFSDNPRIQRKIESVVSKLSGIKYADSFSADFHKTGFCPYAAGVFISKDEQKLLDSNKARGKFLEYLSFGEWEPFRQTFENSRSALPIISSWIAIRRMGLDGLRQFILYQLEVSELFKEKIRRKFSKDFEILNNHSNGWELVLKPHFLKIDSWDYLQSRSSQKQEKYINNCYGLLNTIWNDPIDKDINDYPVIGFVPKYSRKGAFEKSLPAFLIHPTSLHYNEQSIDEMVNKIVRVKHYFDSRIKKRQQNFNKESFYEMVPPK